MAAKMERAKADHQKPLPSLPSTDEFDSKLIRRGQDQGLRSDDLRAVPEERIHARRRV